MKRNGSITAHGHEWPLYELWVGGVMVLRMSVNDKAEMRRLQRVVEYAWE